MALPPLELSEHFEVVDGPSSSSLEFRLAGFDHHAKHSQSGLIYSL